MPRRGGIDIVGLVIYQQIDFASSACCGFAQIVLVGVSQTEGHRQPGSVPRRGEFATAGRVTRWQLEFAQSATWRCASIALVDVT